MEKAGPRGYRYDCMVQGAKTLESAEYSAKDVMPRESASNFFISIAQRKFARILQVSVNFSL